MEIRQENSFPTSIKCQQFSWMNEFFLMTFQMKNCGCSYPTLPQGKKLSILFFFVIVCQEENLVIGRKERKESSNFKEKHFTVAIDFQLLFVVKKKEKNDVLWFIVSRESFSYLFPSSSSYPTPPSKRVINK